MLPSVLRSPLLGMRRTYPTKASCLRRDPSAARSYAVLRQGVTSSYAFARSCESSMLKVHAYTSGSHYTLQVEFEHPFVHYRRARFHLRTPPMSVLNTPCYAVPYPASPIATIRSPRGSAVMTVRADHTCSRWASIVVSCQRRYVYEIHAFRSQN